ncbi:putative phytosulfokines 6 [Cardamine amara subsp. amara]|uniref:Phytosulfokine n=1 Tax=Cardamine amara subsp. amara TaxID=228776 RepID=A0ABD1A475_CARAN
MEKKVGIMFFLFVLLLLQLSELRTAQRPLQVDQEEAVKASEMAQDQELSHLMGEETCEVNDKECMKRRIISESHLDYIYTQSHNKP